MLTYFLDLFFPFCFSFFWSWSGWQQSIKAIVFPHHILQRGLLLRNELCPQYRSVVNVVKKTPALRSRERLRWIGAGRAFLGIQKTHFSLREVSPLRRHSPRSIRLFNGKH